MGGDLSIRRVHSLPNHFSSKEKISCAAKKRWRRSQQHVGGKGSVAVGREGKESSILHADDTHTHTGFPEKKTREILRRLAVMAKLPSFPFFFFPSISIQPPSPLFPFRVSNILDWEKEGGWGERREGKDNKHLPNEFNIQQLNCFILCCLNKTNYAAFSSKFGKCLFRLKKGRGERGTVGREGGRGGPSILC